MGGGFFQSLKSSFLLRDIKKYNSEMELIITDNSVKPYISNKNLKYKIFKKNIFINYLSQFFEIDLIRDLFNKLKINHPFTNFVRKNSYDLIIFIGPSTMARYCKEIAFIYNVFDLDHKKNSQFPEHNSNLVFEYREKLFKEIISRAFKIIVPHKIIKDDLINFYNSQEKNIVIQGLIPLLPTIHKENITKNVQYKKLFDSLNLPKNKKIIFYPAQFWAHKNHKYIVDTAEILKKNNNSKYFFVFCGSSKGNGEYIKKLILKKNLGNYFKTLNYINDDEIISLYLNVDAVVMPTYGGPTNLPIYESFYFKKIIFYTKNLIPNDNINNRMIDIDISSPKDFFNKLNICFDDSKIKEITDSNYEYFKEICSEETFKNNYEKILNDFSYLLSRWR